MRRLLYAILVSMVVLMPPVVTLAGYPSATLPAEGTRLFQNLGEHLADNFVDRVIREWWIALDKQAQGKYKPLPESFKTAVAHHYPVDLDAVLYAENIDTGMKDIAVTVGDKIYFPSPLVYMYRWEELHLLLHELEHVVQYEQAGGKEAFAVQYLLQGARAFMGTRKGLSYELRDEIPLEKEADRKADRIIDEVNNALHPFIDGVYMMRHNSLAGVKTQGEWKVARSQKHQGGDVGFDILPEFQGRAVSVKFAINLIRGCIRLGIEEHARGLTSYSPKTCAPYDGLIEFPTRVQRGGAMKAIVSLDQNTEVVVQRGKILPRKM